jgi:hypothetical protein
VSLIIRGAARSTVPRSETFTAEAGIDTRVMRVNLRTFMASKETNDLNDRSNKLVLALPKLLSNTCSDKPSSLLTLAEGPSVTVTVVEACN